MFSKYVIHFMKLTFNGYIARHLDSFSVGFEEKKILSLICFLYQTRATELNMNNYVIGAFSQHGVF